MSTKPQIVPSNTGTKAQLLAGLKPIVLTGDGFSVTLEPCEFSTGSIGWKVAGGTKLSIQGQKVVPSMNLVVAKSKELT